MAGKALKPLSGMRDFLPGDVVKRNYVIGIISEIYEKHGFQPLETPTMERLSLLMGKYGEEGDKLLFKVLHRGAKLDRALDKESVDKKDLTEIGLRYDLTVPLARVYALHREELSAIFKRYQIQPVWRADRPAKGRFREFYQCDVDIIGSEDLLAEIDIFTAICEIMPRLGFSDFSIHLNHRVLLFEMLKSIGIPDDKATTVLISLDKLDKIGREGVLNDLKTKEIEDESVNKLLPLFNLVESGNPVFGSIIEYFESISLSENGLKALKDLEFIINFSMKNRMSNNILVNPLLARGLDYYTGTIFELRLKDESSSAGGGGRYDNLVGSFSGKDASAVGFSFGLERILGVMEEKNMFPELSPIPVVTFAFLDKEYVTEGLNLVDDIRNEGIKVDLFPKFTTPKKVFKWASRVGVRFVILVGENEINSGIYTIKDLSSGEVHKISKSDILQFLKKI